MNRLRSLTVRPTLCSIEMRFRTFQLLFYFCVLASFGFPPGAKQNETKQKLKFLFFKKVCAEQCVRFYALLVFLPPVGYLSLPLFCFSFVNPHESPFKTLPVFVYFVSHHGASVLTQSHGPLHYLLQHFPPPLSPLLFLCFHPPGIVRRSAGSARINNFTFLLTLPLYSHRASQI